MRIKNVLLSGAAFALFSMLAYGQAHAMYTIDVVESGGNVVATGSGSLNLTALGEPSSAGWGASTEPTAGWLFVGGDSSADVYYGYSGPASIGTSSTEVDASSSSGLLTGIFAEANALYISAGYVSGTSISGTATWDNATLDSLGLTAGTYTWTWGSGADADSFVINISGGSTDVPEPGSLALIGVPLAVGGLLRRRRVRSAA